MKMIENVMKTFRDDLPSGLYSVTLTQGQRIIATEKLVIMD